LIKTNLVWYIFRKVINIKTDFFNQKYLLKLFTKSNFYELSTAVN
jgi:hypothetical protein